MNHHDDYILIAYRRIVIVGLHVMADAYSYVTLYVRTSHCPFDPIALYIYYYAVWQHSIQYT